MELHNLIETCVIIALSLLLLPLSTTIAAASYAYATTSDLLLFRRRSGLPPAFQRRTILVTGAATAEGLRIARAFSEAGHIVIGAEFAALDRIPIHSRFSRAIRRFYVLRSPNDHYGPWLYIKDLIHIVQKEKVDLWINSSNIVSILDDAQAGKVLREKTSCVSFALSDDHASRLETRDKFLDYTKSIGLLVPEVHQVSSRDEVHNFLNDSSGKKKYTLRPGETESIARSMAVILPRRTMSQTYHQVSVIKITKDRPWKLEQCLDDMEQYSAFAIIVQGCVKAFAASPVTAASPCYQAISTHTGPGRAMLRFVQSFAKKAGEDLTTHLSIDFRIGERVTELGFERTVLPVDCHVGPGPAVLLFAGSQGSSNLAKSYLSIKSYATNGVKAATDNKTGLDVFTPVVPAAGVYFIGSEAVSLVLRPLLQFAALKTNAISIVRNTTMFANHLVFWRDGIYETWDPLPAWWLYHIYVPFRLTMAVLHNRGIGEVDVKKLLG